MEAHNSSSEDSGESTCLSPERAQYVEYCNLVISTIGEINNNICETRPCMTSTQAGKKWIKELLEGHPDRIHDAFRMSKRIFIDLLHKLEDDHELQGSQRTTSREVLGITLFILAHGGSVRLTKERFQHSTETISRYFAKGLNSLLLLSMDVIKPIDQQFREIPAEIRYDAHYMPFFKDCVGAIDGTHVDARVPVEDQVKYIGRHGTTTQNVMVVCDFNMCFTFALAGWEGSAHDSRIFARALTDDRLHFPHPPQGKYYLVDAEYPLKTGYLKPYPDTRYHLADYACGSRPVQGRHEYFNKAHSSLRSVIERTFGVWKKKWHILKKMPQYTFKKQCVIVPATMALHNFIRRHPSRWDPEFNACDANQSSFMPSEDEDPRAEEGIETDMFDVGGVDHMSAVRDSIAEELYNTRR